MVLQAVGAVARSPCGGDTGERQGEGGEGAAELPQAGVSPGPTCQVGMLGHDTHLRNSWLLSSERLTAVESCSGKGSTNEKQSHRRTGRHATVSIFLSSLFLLPPFLAVKLRNIYHFNHLKMLSSVA